MSPRFSSHCRILFLFSCDRCPRILALFVMMRFHLQVRVVFVELPLPRCSCQLIGLPGAGNPNLGVNFGFLLHCVLRPIFVFSEGFVPLAHMLRLGPSLILCILVLVVEFWGISHPGGKCESLGGGGGGGCLARILNASWVLVG